MKVFVMLLGLAGLVLLGYVALYFLSDRNQQSIVSRQGELLLTNIDIENLDILSNQLQPDMKIFVIEGVVADGCSQLSEPVLTQNGMTINIELRAFRPDDVECSNFDKQNFSTDLEFDTSELDPGNYIVTIEGVEADLVID